MGDRLSVSFKNEPVWELYVVAECVCVWTSGWTPGVRELMSARYDIYTMEEVRRRNLGQT